MKTLKEKLLEVLKDEETPVKEEVKEDEKEDEKVEQAKKDLMAEFKSIVKEAVKSNKEVSAESKDKAAKIVSSPRIEVNETKEVIYTRKNGQKLTMKKSEAVAVKDWFKAVTRKDFKSADEMYKNIEVMTKGNLEPMNESTAADGGVLVPTILADFIVAIRDDQEVMRPNSYIMNVEGMKSNTFDIPKELTHPKVAWEGIEQYNSDKSTSSMQFEKQTLTPYTVATIVAITNQLIEDSPFRMPQIIAEQLGRALANESDRVSIKGSGTNEPTGLDSYTPGVTIDGGSNLSYTHMTSAYWRMSQGYRNNAVWLMNSSRIALVQNLRDSNNMPIFQPQLLAGVPPTLMGKSVLENNNVGNDRIYLVNLKDYYYYCIKHGVRISTSDQAYVAGISTWQRNMTAVRAEERYDAELLDTRALVMIQNP